MPSSRHNRPFLRAVLLSLIVAGSVSGVLAGASSATRPTRFTDSIRAMDTLPPVSIPSSAVGHAVARAASATNGDEARALRTLRLLRPNLGPEGGTIYAYSPRDELLCVIHWPRAGTCDTGTNDSRPGVALLFSPGGPGYPGQADDLPAAVAGVVADSVTGVALQTGGRVTSLRIENNAFFGELRRPILGEPWDAAVRFTYADGSEAVTDIADPRQ